MSTYAYNEILRRFQSLPPSEQRKLFEDIKAIIQQQNMQQPLHSLLELEGLGQEVWQGIGAQKYIDEERDSWDSHH